MIATTGDDPPPLRALLLVDHGSRREAANAMLAEVAELVRAQAPDGWIIRYAHMELAPPTIAEALADCVAAGAREVTVHPYMLAKGRHAAEDIPRMAREAAAAFPGVRVRVTEPLGVHPLLAAVVLERAGLEPSR